jgi:hypothetical protein
MYVKTGETFWSFPVNVLEGLQIIRQRLVDNDAKPATLALVAAIAQRAALPAAQAASSQSLLQLVRMLQRTPVATNDIDVYNDLLRLEDEMSAASQRVMEQRALEDARPAPKTKKHYKDLKDREQKQS